MDYLAKISEALKSIRKVKKLRQWQLAHKLGVHKSFISKIETGSNGSLQTIQRHCETLNCDIYIKIIDRDKKIKAIEIKL